MPRHSYRGLMEGLMESTKTRKRECSSPSSSSSRIHNYRLNKRAILVGKNRVGLGIGLGGSRSSTPVPTWRTTPLRSNIESPRYSQSGKSTQPVSARKLAATLWGMNEMPSPKMSESNLELMQQQRKNSSSKMMLKREKMRSGSGLHSGSGSLPPHLSDPSHSPAISERMDRSGKGHQRRTPSIVQRLRSSDENAGAFDSLSNGSFMEIETRSRAQTPSGSISGTRNRLKDISNALTTSKELLKIINRIWARADQPSSSMSLISALHAELERARLQVNQLIQEQLSDINDINHLMKCFAEEKAAWKSKEQQAVESATESIAGELDVERKLRRRFENLNKKLGKELAEMKSSFMKAVKELETEKRAREFTEQVCDELAQNVDEDRVEVEKLKRESTKVHKDVGKEREMLRLADDLCEERAQVKISESKHQFEGKNSAINKLRKQLEAFLGSKRGKDEEKAAYLSKSHFGLRQNEERDDGEVDDALDDEEDFAESDLHSIELNMDNCNGIYKKSYNSIAGPRRLPIDDEIKGRNSISGQVSRKSTSILRSISDGVEWGNEGATSQNLRDGLDRERFHELEKGAPRRSYVDETQRYKSVKGLNDHALSSSRLGPVREYPSPTRQREQRWPLRDDSSTIQERSSIVPGNGSKSRLADVRGEGQNARRSKW
ncbi:golgin family A [Olea europaea subsp. europaea]|uniref:Golgin family A n=2 Tax=Olea europaea subsp. europaea TaxID=158383 RepID=A0A8S0QHE0_OLEEU|nr:golgin family A [Olea europaea subsp. europaea]